MEVLFWPYVGARESSVLCRSGGCQWISIALSCDWRTVVSPCTLHSDKRRILHDAQAVSMLSVYELRMPPEFGWGHSSRPVFSAQSIRSRTLGQVDPGLKLSQPNVGPEGQEVWDLLRAFAYDINSTQQLCTLLSYPPGQHHFDLFQFILVWYK